MYRRLFAYARPYLRGLALAMVAMVVAAATEPLFPALMKTLLDDGFAAPGGFELWYVPVAIIAIFVVRGIATFTSNYALTWVANKVLVDVRREMFARVVRLPAPDFEREAAGQLISKIVFEVNNVTLATTSVLTIIVRDTLVLVGLLGWLLYLNLQLTLVALALIPVFALVVVAFSRRMRMLNRRSLEHTGELTRVVEEAVHGYKVIKVFGAYARQAQIFGRTSDHLRGFAMRNAIAGGATVPITQLCAAIAMAIVVSIALAQSIDNQVTVGGFVSFITAMLMLLAPLKRLADINNALQRGLAAAERVFELIDRPIEEDLGSATIDRASGAIRFEGVSFRYPGAERDALHEVDLDIRAGELVALVGSSGGGKTTLVNLVPRFLAPTSGRVLIDSVAVDELALESLRAQIALVSQDIVLFNDTVRSNVAFGASDAVDDARVWAALGAAALERFVRELPAGLDTVIGERGATLSGGQRQRLAIARALYKDAPILLLDEATSALDSQTERDVQGALERTMSGRTTLVIAHRLSTIERADRILVLEGGHIVEQGRHGELIAAGGAYALLHRIQYSGEAGKRID
ncbi:MAG: lipid A export permease/ATP-binding protein MsbA [Burkholderiaceae bacterium]|nr:lipid A export permease/ATP-binding protein MsbA [Burkholderiaceae bacterium]